MKKNAFTLIELIATIAILGMLATILITVSVRKINESKEHARDTLLESIELSAQTYVIENIDELEDFRKNDYIYVTLQTLVEKEYFTNSLVDPTTKKSLPLTDKVYVIRNQEGNVIATYDVNQREKANIILNGSYNEYLKVGSTYEEKGVIATSPEGTNVTSEVIIEGTVNTRREATYVIKYTYNNKTITRNVIVYEGDLPSEDVEINGATYIRNLYINPTTREENGLIKDNTKDANIRYAGSNDDVKNYVEFGNEGELWRIIGVFNVSNGTTTANRIKLVRDESIGNMSWDSSADGTIEGETAVNAGFGVNQWGESTYEDGSTYEGADLMRLLNEYYLGKTGTTCTYCNGVNQSVCSNDCSSSVTPLSTTSKNMIDNTVWNLGAKEYVDILPLSDMYTGEKSIQVGNSLCEKGTEFCDDTVIRTTKWLGKIGLIYPSDYGYASTNENCAKDVYGSDSYCEGNNWLYNNSSYWTISPYAATNYARVIWFIYNNNSILGTRANTPYGVRPSVYLSPDVKIVDGTGTDTDPYQLSL